MRRSLVGVLLRERRKQRAPVSAPMRESNGHVELPERQGSTLNVSSRLRHPQRTFRSRTQSTAAPRRDRQHGRHDDRVVRLPALRHGDRAGLRQAVLPEVRPAGRRRCRRSASSSSASSARPIGAAIFGHYGDRIGRKATLIVDLADDRHRDRRRSACVPTYDSIGIWGAVLLTVIRLIQGIGVGGEWGGSVLLAMEWARTNKNRGFIASWPQFGAPCGLFLANCRGAVLQLDLRRPVPDLGLAHPVPPQHRHGRRRAVDPARHPRRPRCSRRSSTRNASSARRCSRC